ncbi:queuosine precursor transporter [uncultured Mailhella sp.]|uniref:queuosine precursor transporter n=1 Tax=uncultured Mailhella sp. TaxID=1981031 RepID=UPI002626A334|nr:queuosine precursor transporter [uncultured Mailhella sp.]
MKNFAVSPVFMLLGLLFCTCLMLSNLMAVKLFQFGPIALPAAVIIFPLSYIINDCISEIWGYRRARLIIWLGFAMNFLMVVVSQIALALPSAPFWDGAEHFHYVFGLAPRLAFASFTAFLAGSFMNAYVMSRMKVASRGRHFSARAILSTVLGEGVDSLIFFPLAFGGTMPPVAMLTMMLGQVTLKTLYEILILPVTVRVVEYVKRVEGADVYDEHISYNILRIREI